VSHLPLVLEITVVVPKLNKKGNFRGRVKYTEGYLLGETEATLGRIVSCMERVLAVGAEEHDRRARNGYKVLDCVLQKDGMASPTG